MKFQGCPSQLFGKFWHTAGIACSCVVLALLCFFCSTHISKSVGYDCITIFNTKLLVNNRNRKGLPDGLTTLKR